MRFIDFLKSLPNKPEKRFKVGQEVTLRKSIRWMRNLSSENGVVGPRFGDVVFVTEYYSFKNRSWYICVSGYPDSAFQESMFEPVLTNNQLEDALGELNRIVMIDHE